MTARPFAPALCLPADRSASPATFGQGMPEEATALAADDDDASDLDDLAALGLDCFEVDSP